VCFTESFFLRYVNIVEKIMINKISISLLSLYLPTGVAWCAIAVYHYKHEIVENLVRKRES
jgi:hypothetical protein